MKLRTILIVCLTGVIGAAQMVGQTATDKAWAQLTLGVGEKSVEKRARAVLSLGLIGTDKKAVEIAETALGDPEESVRASAATALGQMESRASAGKLKQAVRDEQASVVFAATNALFLLGDPAAFEVYYAVLAGEKKSGDSLLESQSKMIKDPKALAKIGFEQGIGFVPFGGASYAAFKMVTKDDVSPVRAASATKLAKDPDPKSRDLLLKSIEDKKWLVRAGVIDALAKRGDPSAIPAIESALDDDNDVVRFTAAAAIIRLSKSTGR